MTDRDKLRAMDACAPALRWIGDRTIEQAWRECGRPSWMCWLLRKIAPDDPRCRLAAADFAERVWHLIPDETTRLAAAWAIGAVRRGDRDEMCAAFAATYAAADYTSAATTSAAVTVAATYAADAASRASDAAASAASAADAYAARSFARRTDESAAQADILRQYFSAREIAVMFSRS